MQNNRLAHPLWELAPPQENPGSATARDTLGYVCIPDKRALLTEWELIFKNTTTFRLKVTNTILFHKSYIGQVLLQYGFGWH